jgi:uncharacterized membrane protein
MKLVFYVSDIFGLSVIKPTQYDGRMGDLTFLYSWSPGFIYQIILIEVFIVFLRPQKQILS